MPAHMGSELRTRTFTEARMLLLLPMLPSLTRSLLGAVCNISLHPKVRGKTSRVLSRSPWSHKVTNNSFCEECCASVGEDLLQCPLSSWPMEQRFVPSTGVPPEACYRVSTPKRAVALSPPHRAPHKCPWFLPRVPSSAVVSTSKTVTHDITERLKSGCSEAKTKWSLPCTHPWVFPKGCLLLSSPMAFGDLVCDFMCTSLLWFRDRCSFFSMMS